MGSWIEDRSRPCRKLCDSIRISRPPQWLVPWGTSTACAGRKGRGRVSRSVGRGGRFCGQTTCLFTFSVQLGLVHWKLKLSLSLHWLWTFGNPSDSVIQVKVPDLVTQLGSSLFLWHGSMGQRGNGCYRMSQKHGFLSSLLNLFPLLPKSSQKTDDAF